VENTHSSHLECKTENQAQSGSLRLSRLSHVCVSRETKVVADFRSTDVGATFGQKVD
jgi:hypothetical protein